MKRMAKTISPSSEKVFLAVFFILFINQFHHFAFLMPIWLLFPEHYIIEVIFYLIIPLICCILRKNKVFPKELLFSKVLKIYFLFIVVNIITCYIFRRQSPLVSIYGWGTFFLILYYPVFDSFNYKSRFWEKVLLWLYCIFLICYFCQYFLRFSGIQIFYLDSTLEQLEDSSVVRLYADGVLSLGVFFCLNRWITKHSKKYMIFFVLGLIAEILLSSRIRWVILPLACIYLFYKMYGFSAKTIKYLIVGLGLFIAFLQTDIARERIDYVLEKAERQSFNNDSYVRVLLIDYFQNEHFKTPVEHFMGSGMPKLNAARANLALSSYSRYMSSLFIDDDFYCYDMGYLGLSWLAGIPFALVLLFLLFSVFRKKVPKNYLYIGAWELYLLMSGWFNEEVFGFTNMICQVLALTILSAVIKENSSINKQNQVTVV